MGIPALVAVSLFLALVQLKIQRLYRSVQVLPVARQRAAGGAGGAADHLHPPGDGRK